MRATLIVALFFMCTSSTQALAKTPNYQEIISQAYALSVDKKRPQAIDLLVKFLKTENSKTPAAKEATQALEQVANIFYNEKTQQEYELISSTQGVNSSEAIGKLKEILKIEPLNLEIISTISKLQILVGDCAGALETLKEVREKLGSLIEATEIISAQANVCSGQYESYLKQKTNSATQSTKSNSVYWFLIDTEYNYKIQNFTKAKDALQMAVKADPNYAEIYYWQWKIDSEALKSLVPAQQYLNTCKKMTSRDFQKYNLDLRVCKKQPEVEAYLKKQSSQENQ